jgi:hypothetical protein
MGSANLHIPLHLPSTWLAMDMDMDMPLPLELVLNIITCSLPAAPDALLDASHPTTKLLLAFTLVCHETRRLACRYLRQHCVYLDHPRRLEAYMDLMPSRPALGRITSLSLSTLLMYDLESDLHICILLSNLFNSVSETLKKLVIDMPLSTYFGPQDQDEHLALLRAGFEKLVNLEEVTSVQGELYLSIHWDEHEGHVWRCWPRLKLMSLGNAVLGQDFWREVALHPSLQTLVVSGAKVFRNCNPKARYLRHSSRPLRVVVVADPDQRLGNSIGLWWGHHWETMDPNSIMTVSEYIDPPGSRFAIYGDDRRERLIKSGAEDGSLWNLTGEVIPCLICLRDTRIDGTAA